MKNMTQNCHIVNNVSTKIKWATLFILMSSLAACAPQSMDKSENQINAQSALAQIINGEVVTATDLTNQHTVFIFDIETNKSCTGVIISTNVILTAAHCLNNDPEQYQIIFSNNIKDLQSSEKRAVLKLERHANYSVRQFMSIDTGDIGILQIRGEIPTNYKSVHILSDFQKLQPGTPIVVAGYGAHELPALEEESVVQEVVALAPQKNFKFKESPILRKSTLQISNPHQGVDEVIVNQEGKQGVCFGDSGGPAYIESNNQLLLWGVISRGTRKCRGSSFYTKLENYMPWILEFISNSPVDNSLPAEETPEAGDDLLAL